MPVDQESQQSGEQKEVQQAIEPNDGSQAMLEDPDCEDPIADDKELQTTLVNLCQHFAGLEKYPRRTEVTECRRQRFYGRGDQYIVWDTTNYLFAPWTGAGSDGGT